jgi:hypothetical protein
MDGSNKGGMVREGLLEEVALSQNYKQGGWSVTYTEPTANQSLAATIEHFLSA